MERATPIETALGVLHGRDCVFLDAVQRDGSDNITFTGDINGALVSKRQKDEPWFPYRLTFHHVVACFSCELDTYENLSEVNAQHESCFDWVEESAWLSALPIRKDFDKTRYRHYRLFTYDTVFHIIASAYKMEIEL